MQNGAACNDGIYCTTGEPCNAAGLCSGNLVSGCGDPGIGSCSSTTPYDQNINIFTTTLTINITIDGQPLTTTNDSTTTSIYAVDTTTGTRHRLGYWYRSSGFVEVYATGILPGNCNILYRGGITSDSDKYNFITNASDSTPNGMTYLAQCISIP